MKAAVPVVVAALAACAPQDADNPCERAREQLAACTGEQPPPLPPEGCVGTYAAAAEQALSEGCEGGKYDGNSFFCRPDALWMGLCKPRPIGEAAAVAELADVCGGRSDALCGALRDRDFVAARDQVRSIVANDPDANRDRAIHYYVRERAIALFAWRVLGQSGFFDGYFTAVDKLLADHLPAYPRGSIEMARWYVPPIATSRACSEPTAALLMFPGVVRLIPRDEFAEFAVAARDALPCLEIVRVDTGSFVDPAVNAQRAKAAVAALDARLGKQLPLHLLGYSQGSANALRSLVDVPELAARTRTVMTMNSAAHGSEVADMLGGTLTGALAQDCSAWPIVMRPACEWAAAQGVLPSDGVIRAIAFAMGIPPDDFKRFFAAEDGIAASPNLRAFLVNHLPGIDSLTTTAAAKFWSARGRELPREPLYLSFRAAITDKPRNLPPSNALFAALIERADGFEAWNDMQVRLNNQSLGGPVADIEVVGRVVEGNHWQWQLADNAVPASVMDPEMTRRTPDVDMLIGHYLALGDAGWLE